MDKPICIGDLVINLSNLCYSRDGNSGELHLFMNCGLLTLRGEQARLVKNEIASASRKVGRSPQLPIKGHKSQVVRLSSPIRHGRR